MNKPLTFKNKLLDLIESDISMDIADQLESTLDGAPNNELGKKLEDDALNSVVDDTISPEEYLSDPEQDRELQQRIDTRNKEIASVIEGWANDIGEMIEKLNGTSEVSIQTILGKAQTGTLFSKVQSANSRKLANAAQELASLQQSLLSFIPQKAISTN